MQGKKPKKKDIKGHPYPYLSINQTNKVQINKECDPYASLDCLNIKLDKKGEMRQTQFNSFKSKVLGSLTRNSKESLFNCEQKKQLPRIFMKKTVINPQQLLQAATAKVHKQAHRQDCVGHKRRISSNECKKQIIHKAQLREADHNTATIMPKHFSFQNSNTTQSTKTRPKKYFFKKMLKKCDKLIEISKFESQLIHTGQVKEQNALRIHSEPVTLVEYKVDHQDKVIDNRRMERINIMFVNQEFQVMKMRPQDFIENKTLQIRKYSHQIQKMKSLFRKQLTRHELSMPKKKISLQMPKSSKKNEIFGPWDTINQSFCLSRD